MKVGHDQLFKDVLHAFFHGFLQIFLPEVAAAIDPEAISFLDPEMFTDVPTGARRVADLAAQVRARTGAPELILVHTEIQSKETDDFPYRVWEYNALLTIRHQMPVISIAFLPFSDSGGVILARYSQTLFGQEYAQLDYWRIPLAGLTAEDYLAAEPVLGAALAALMHPRTSDRVGLRVAILERLAASTLDEARQYLLVNLVETYLELNEAEQAAYTARLRSEGRQAVETIEMTWADRMREEGREQGVAQGREQGVAQGREQARREDLLDLIQTRFGLVPENLAGRVARADDAMLTRLLRQVVLVERVEDLDQ